MSNAVYIGVDNIARKVKKMYAGVDTEVPIYENTMVTKEYPLNLDNLDRYFTVDTVSGYNGWSYSDYGSGGLNLVPGSFSSNMTNATITLTAKTNLTNVTIAGAYNTNGSTYNEIRSVKVAGSNKISNSSTSFAYKTIWTGSLSEGQTIYLAFFVTKTSSATNASNTYFTLNCDALSETVEEETIVGYETLPVARKVKKGYVGVAGVARRFWPPNPFISYSGDYTVANIEHNGQPYELYTLTTSGTLVLGDNVDYWMCGGGGSGGSGYYSTRYAKSGGGGGGGYLHIDTLSAGNHVVSIGAGGANTNTNGSATTIGSVSANGGQAGYQYSSAVGAGQGGSGGGCSYDASASSKGVTTTVGINGTTYYCGLGEGISTYPFGIESLYAHCAGGASGYARYYYESGSTACNGYDRGINGGSNGSGTYGYHNFGSAGGVKGGGNTDTAASFYGAGGGGGSATYKVSGSTTNYKTEKKNGQAGYQGVVYLLIPV